MCELVIVKEREMNAKKTKYHEILQNSKILHTQSKLEGEIFKLTKFCNKRIILSSQNRDDFF